MSVNKFNKNLSLYDNSPDNVALQMRIYSCNVDCGMRQIHLTKF